MLFILTRIFCLKDASVCCATDCFYEMDYEITVAFQTLLVVGLFSASFWTAYKSLLLAVEGVICLGSISVLLLFKNCVCLVCECQWSQHFGLRIKLDHHCSCQKVTGQFMEV